MRPDEMMPRVVDPDQPPILQSHPQGNSIAPTIVPTTSTRQANGVHSIRQNRAPVAAASTSIQHKHAAQRQHEHMHSGKQRQHPPKQGHETEHERQGHKTSSHSTSSRRHSQSIQSPSATSSADVIASMALHDHLMQAAHYAQALQQRNTALEAENKILLAAVQQHKTSAIDWCHMAKVYQQDRNMMTLRLEELEMELAQMAHQKVAEKVIDQIGRLNTEAGIQSTSDNQNIDNLETRYQFIRQSITQLLDDM
ncbi:hypothetical protein FBU30_006162 [Linnemannia zychae]|nr:hypothetical protein FBU30_006162 [Linnemannia zychae]